MWNWLQSLSGGAANFVGSLTGALVGLIALLVGALFNAHLNRKRDDAIRRADARGVAAALRAELLGIMKSLLNNAEDLSDPLGDFVVPDVAHSVRVMPELVSKFGMLEGVNIQIVIGAYVSIDQYCESIIMCGGKILQNNRPDRRLIAVDKERAARVVQVNRSLATVIQPAIGELDGLLARMRHR